MPCTPLRILHCAMFSLNKYGANYYSGHTRISNGLIRNGHFVYNFSYRDVARDEAPLGIKRLGLKKMNKRLIEAAERICADVVLLGHAESVTAQTLEEIKTRLPDCKIAMWWVDWWHNLLKFPAIYEPRMPLLDGFFMTTDPDFVCEVYEPARQVERFHFMPNSCDPSMDTGRAYEHVSPRYDVTFIGRKTVHRDDFVTFLREHLADLNFGLFGQGRKNFITGRQYLDTLSNSRIGINYSRDISMPLCTSNRMVHLAANGCLVITPETPGMRSLFTEKEVVYFDNLPDMNDKIRYYLAHPDEAQSIARAGRKKAHDQFNCTRVTARMLDQIYDTNQNRTLLDSLYLNGRQSKRQRF